MKSTRTVKERLQAKLAKAGKSSAQPVGVEQRIRDLLSDNDIQWQSASTCLRLSHWQGRIDALEICYQNIAEVMRIPHIENWLTKQQREKLKVQQGDAANEISKCYCELNKPLQRETWLKKAAMLDSEEGKRDFKIHSELKASQEELKQIKQEKPVTEKQATEKIEKLEKIICHFQQASTHLLAARNISIAPTQSKLQSIAQMFKVYYVGQKGSSAFESQIDKIEKSALFIQQDFDLMFSLVVIAFDQGHDEELIKILRLIVKMTPRSAEDKEILYHSHAMLAYFHRRDVSVMRHHLQAAAPGNIPLANYLFAMMTEGEEKASYLTKAAAKNCLASKLFLIEMQPEKSTRHEDKDYIPSIVLEVFNKESHLYITNGYYPKPELEAALHFLVSATQKCLMKEQTKTNMLTRFVEYRFWLSMGLRFSKNAYFLNCLLNAYVTHPQQNFKLSQLKELVDRYGNTPVQKNGEKVFKPFNDEDKKEENILNTLGILHNSMLKTIAPEQHNRVVIKPAETKPPLPLEIVIPDEIHTLEEEFLVSEQIQKIVENSVGYDVELENKISNFICLAGIIFHYHLKSDRRQLEKYHPQIMSVLNNAVEIINKFESNTLCLMLLSITRLNFHPAIPPVANALHQFLQVIICILPNCSMLDVSYVLLSLGLTKLSTPMKDFYIIALSDEIELRLSKNTNYQEKEIGLLLYSFMLLEEGCRTTPAHQYIIEAVSALYQWVGNQWKNRWQQDPSLLSPHFNRQLIMVFHYFKSCCPQSMNVPDNDFFLYLNETFLWQEDPDYTDDTQEKISEFMLTENFYAVLSTTKEEFSPNNEIYTISQLEESVFDAIRTYFGKTADVLSSPLIKGLSVDIRIVQGERALNIQVNGPNHYLHGMNGSLVLNNKSRVNQLLIGNCEIICYQDWQKLNTVEEKQQFIKQFMDKQGFYPTVLSSLRQTFNSSTSFIANMGGKNGLKKNQNTKTDMSAKPTI